MGYERYVNNVKVVFTDEESYLRCRLNYLDYVKQFAEGEDYLSFITFVKDRFDDPAIDWEIENIDDQSIPQSNTNTFTFQLDPSGELSEGCIINIDSNPIGIATDYNPNSQTASVSLSNGLYMGVDGDGQLLYTTYVPGTEPTANLNNGWVKTSKTYELSTEHPKEREKRLKEEQERNKFNRFDILDFD